MANEIRRLFSHTFITSIATVAQGGLTFLLLPLYTRYLGPSAFGKVELLAATSMLASTVVMQGLPSALSWSFNLRYADDTSSRSVCVSTALAHIFSSTAALSLLCAAFAPTLSDLILGEPDHAWLVVVAAGGVMANAVTNMASQVMRGLYRTTALSLIVLASVLCNAGLSLYLILVADQTFEALIYGIAFGHLVSGVWLTWAIRDHIAWEISLRELRRMLGYGAPLILAGISFHLLSLADRYFLRWFMDDSAVGVYAVAVRFASILELAAFGPFRKVWTVMLYDIGRRADAPEVFGRFATRFVAAGFVAVLGLTLFVDVPIGLLFDPRFHLAAPIVGILAFGLLLFATSEIAKVGLLLREQTRLLPLRVVIAALVNVALDIVLIPRFGLHGAAAATATAYLVLVLTSHLLARRIYRIRYEPGRLALLIAASVPVVVVHVGSEVLEPVPRSLARAGVFALFVLSIFALRIVYWHEVTSLARHGLDAVRRRAGAPRQ